MPQLEGSPALRVLKEQPRSLRSPLRTSPFQWSRSSPASQQRRAAFEEVEVMMATVELYGREKDAALEEVERLKRLLEEKEASSNEAAKMHQLEIVEVRRQSIEVVRKMRMRSEAFGIQSARASAAEGERLVQQIQYEKDMVSQVSS